MITKFLVKKKLLLLLTKKMVLKIITSREQFFKMPCAKGRWDIFEQIGTVTFRQWGVPWSHHQCAGVSRGFLTDIKEGTVTLRHFHEHLIDVTDVGL